MLMFARDFMLEKMNTADNLFFAFVFNYEVLFAFGLRNFL